MSYCIVQVFQETRETHEKKSETLKSLKPHSELQQAFVEQSRPEIPNKLLGRIHDTKKMK